MPVIPALRRLRQEDCEFEDSLGDIVRSFFKNKLLNKYPSIHEFLKMPQKAT
jgi:hypothetical protein